MDWEHIRAWLIQRLAYRVWQTHQKDGLAEFDGEAARGYVEAHPECLDYVRSATQGRSMNRELLEREFSTYICTTIFHRLCDEGNRWLPESVYGHLDARR